jgi:hypothetical protein
MKFSQIVLVALTVTTSLALAAEKPEKGLKRHNLSPVVTIDLPKKWGLSSFPMPIPGASNYRIDTGKLRIAITGFPTPPIPQGTENPTLKESFVKDTVVESSSQYLGVSKEKEVTPVVLSGTGYALAYATFSSSTGEPVFPAFYARTYACVSTGMVSTTSTIYSITIGSNDCNGEEHKAALTALSSLRVGG